MERKSILFSGSRIFFTISFFLLNLTLAQAQVILTNLNPYTQNFNTLPAIGSTTWADNSTIPGWYVDNGPTTTIAASTGTDNTDGLKNYGSTSASDRGLGCVTSNATGNFYYGVRLRNNTGAAIRDFIINYRVEQWKMVNNRSTIMKFQYKKGTTVNSLTGTGWTDYTDLNVKTDKGTSNSVVNGNSAGNNFTSGNILISDIELANGEEIMFRWNDQDNNSIYLALDDVTITPSNSQRIFYNSTTGNLQSLNNWTLNADGSNGTKPTTFTGSYQTFIIKNTAVGTISSDWTVSGDNSKVVVGNSSVSVNFIIPSGHAFSGIIDVTDNATLTLNNATCPTLGTLGDLSTVVYNNSANQSLPLNAFGNLTLASGTKSLSTNTQIKNSLTLSGGKLELGNYNLTLNAGATLNSGSATSYIITEGIGRLKRQVQKNNTNVEFPVGTSTAFLPVRIKLANTASTVTDIYSVKAINFIYDNYDAGNNPTGTKYTSKAVNNTWIIDEEVIGNSDVTLTFQWDNANALSDFDLTKTRITHFHDGAWDDATPETATLVNGLYTVSRSNITSFSPFGVFSGNPNPLPVELVNFTAQRTKEGVTCTWETATEKNNNYFAIERSTNGKEFSEIGRKNGAGTTTQTTRYNFTDTNAPAALTYYRLRQTDFDGTTTYSKIIAVTNTKITNAYTTYPNPSQGIRFLKAQTESTSPSNITITDMQGKTVFQTTANAQVLSAGMPIDLSGKPNGLYLITIRTGNETTIIRTIQE